MGGVRKREGKRENINRMPGERTSKNKYGVGKGGSRGKCDSSYP